MLTDQEIQERVIKILAPYMKQADALARVEAATHILDDLRVGPVEHEGVEIGVAVRVCQFV